MSERPSVLLSVFAFVLDAVKEKIRSRRAAMPRCNYVINADELIRFDGFEPNLCNRVTWHVGDHCGCESACDYDEHNDPCICGVYREAFVGSGRCFCGGFP